MHRSVFAYCGSFSYFEVEGYLQHPACITMFKTSVFAHRSRILIGSSIFGAASVYAWNANRIRLDTKPVQLNAEDRIRKGTGTATKCVKSDDIKYHNSEENGVWVVVNGEVYNLTNFMSQHPGGVDVLLQNAGKDALEIFNKSHLPHFLTKFLSAEDHIGQLEENASVEVVKDIEDEEEVSEVGLPPLSEIYNIHDFESLAKKTLSSFAWYYYSSGANDEVSLRENRNAFSRIFFKPRVLVDVEDVDISTTMLGVKTSAPFYCSATAFAQRGHPDGELSIARGCGKGDIIQMISTSSSYSLEEIVGAAREKQLQWFQLYIFDRAGARKTIRECERLGVKSIFVTVDLPLLGRREKDLRTKNAGSGRGGSNPARREPLTWDYIEELAKTTNIPMAIKGVQTAEDVVLAAEKGIRAVVISNHGGRQLDYSRAPVEVLADSMVQLKQRNLDKNIEVFVDGGVRRGSDVIKCLALGAKGVGLGRGFLYANSTYGEAGVQKAIELLKEEIKLNMKLLGVKSIDQLGPQHLDTTSLSFRLAPKDHLYYGNYEPLAPPNFVATD